ncbi:2,3-bisphosphoglycerate-dependent phosphoglycerate mutase [Candidatus Liberibacter sp.]|uniref:2,3-bisphosphoglycerate-dependent phosphoglycerate mutase n=1 Tax=Candidatus Liberibacter sp. TaxID=34022 RepID=UPI0015F3B1A0|nr:2,3-bisphosphoglycerate-dependent phosphoglycerate mutase [Candidatus Liberibacter sp.]MBA5724304.1 2,3-bisphosphoglycerate-dependent phosphoglycerate mutase [Candidatus Liberibacter sp.]
MDRTLVLVRHGQSEWNDKNLFTGRCNPPLTDLGMDEARNVGKKFFERGMVFDTVFSSSLKRAQETCRLILEENHQKDLQSVYCCEDLNERDYGDLSGMNKDEARQKWGDEKFYLWRRSYATAPPGGESLRDTSARVLLYYITTILPIVLQGKSVLITAHGNSLRSLVMALDKIPKEKIPHVTIGTGVPIVYKLAADSTVISKDIFHKTA